MSLQPSTPCDYEPFICPYDVICPYDAECGGDCEYWCGADEPEDIPET